MMHSGAYFDTNVAFFCFWYPERGGGPAPAAPPSGSATVFLNERQLNN